ncbi:triphosphoribosyl-dephospho-CoA synthase [Erwinia sp. CPCC 100877]|nr:triphosphoribosyl-dephospho-CoA synthase [Erwinia sp. CPCC 100877]
MMKINHASETICWQLAQMVETALLEEVSLTPKPGLVDRRSNGAHEDMNHALFVQSAQTLTPYFFEMAQAAWNQPIDQSLRIAIAKIGRKAEKAMYKVTNQVNTHKGAIWALGLTISVAASQISQTAQLDVTTLFADIARLTAYSDTSYSKKVVTHGQNVKQKFGVSGAYGEALAGYPHVQLALKEAEMHKSENKEQRYLHMLLTIIGALDDTCILYRSDEQTLKDVQALANEANQTRLPNSAFNQLNDLCTQQHVSPGGSADLLAVTIFVQALKEWLA